MSEAAVLPPFRFFCCNPGKNDWPVSVSDLLASSVPLLAIKTTVACFQVSPSPMKEAVVGWHGKTRCIYNDDHCLWWTSKSNLKFFNSSRLFVDFLYVIFPFVWKSECQKTDLTGEYHPCHVFFRMQLHIDVSNLQTIQEISNRTHWMDP